MWSPPAFNSWEDMEMYYTFRMNPQEQDEYFRSQQYRRDNTRTAWHESSQREGDNGH